jgi:hypothetical protein
MNSAHGACRNDHLTATTSSVFGHSYSETSLGASFYVFGICDNSKTFAQSSYTGLYFLEWMQVLDTQTVTI